MAKFKFPLAKVMQHRKTLEGIAQTHFQEAMAELNQQLQKLRGMEVSKVDARSQAFRKQSEGGKASPALVQVSEFLKGQDIRIENQKLKIKECESLVENLREILRQKAIDYKIIEGLGERQEKVFKTEQRKLDQKQVDEMNVMRFRREDSEK